MSKYLTYDQRLEIEAGLKENLSFGAIAKKINKDRTTVAKEIKRNLIIKCNDGCAYFDEEVCISKFKPPYVCNGCRNFQKCTLAKPFYSAIDAHHVFSENIS